MSRGIGKTQQSILDVLNKQDECRAEPGPMGWNEWQCSQTVGEIAEAVGISHRQAHKAVRSLEARKLVLITQGFTWRGGGKHGPAHLVDWPAADGSWARDYTVRFIPVDSLRTFAAGETTPDGLTYEFATRWHLPGMPTPALWIWLPQVRIAYLEQKCAVQKAWRGAPRKETLSELQQLESAYKLVLPAGTAP